MFIQNNTDCTQETFGAKSLQIKCLELTVDGRTRSWARISLSTVKIMVMNSW